jgi:hypothetical protein
LKQIQPQEGEELPYLVISENALNYEKAELVDLFLMYITIVMQTYRQAHAVLAELLLK